MSHWGIDKSTINKLVNKQISDKCWQYGRLDDVISLLDRDLFTYFEEEYFRCTELGNYVWSQKNTSLKMNEKLIKS